MMNGDIEMSKKIMNKDGYAHLNNLSEEMNRISELGRCEWMQAYNNDDLDKQEVIDSIDELNNRLLSVQGTVKTFLVDYIDPGNEIQVFGFQEGRGYHCAMYESESAAVMITYFTAYDLLEQIQRHKKTVFGDFF